MLLRLWLILALAAQPLAGFADAVSSACRERASVGCCCASGVEHSEQGACCGECEEPEQAPPASDGDSCCAGSDAETPVQHCGPGPSGPCHWCPAPCRALCASDQTGPLAPASRAARRPPQSQPAPLPAWQQISFGRARAVAYAPAPLSRPPVSGVDRLTRHCVWLL